MKILLLIFIFSASSFAQICDDQGQLGTLSEMAGKKCFSDEITKDDIEYLAIQAEEVGRLCKNCESAFDKLVENKEAVEEKETSYGKAILGELQKELSLISIDLMKMRSSFGMTMNSDKAIKACDFKKNLKKPRCLSDVQQKVFDQQIHGIQNALATELSEIITGTKSKDQGLFVKQDTSCVEIKDKDAMFAQMRYLESLLDTNFIEQLSKLKIKENAPFDFSLLKSLPPKAEQKFNELSMHPLFRTLLDNTSDLEKFIKKASKALSDKNADQTAIIEALYESSSQLFGNNISDRCEHVFDSVSKALEANYCERNKSIVADDLESIQIITGSKFAKLDEKTAEKELKAHCSIINTKKENALSFTQLKNELHKKNNDRLLHIPLSEFKTTAYSRYFQNSAELLCKALANEASCSSVQEKVECSLLKFYKDSQENTLYQSMASQSDDSINLILRSLVGDGLPQKDGKVDQVALKILQEERILPGSTAPAPQRKATASEFHKTVRENSGTTRMAQGSTNKPTEVTPSANTQAAAPEHGSQVYNMPEANIPEYQGQISQTAPKIHKTAKSNSFSNLSDAEQQELLKRLKRSPNTRKSQTPSELLDNDNLGEMVPSTLPSGTFSTAGTGAADPENRTANPKLNDNFNGKKATLDPIKKSSSYNNALVDANTNRSPAGTEVGSAPTVSISKPSKGENEIKIQVDEQELNRVKEFKEKLKTLLDAHGQELSVIKDGEKIIVKINDYKIDVIYVPEEGVYKAVSSSKNIPKDYLNTISYYFNVTLKENKGKREALVQTLKNSKN